MNDRILMKLELRGYVPRARLVDVELFEHEYMNKSGDYRVARGVVAKCYDYTWMRGEVIITTSIQELNRKEGWFITRNSLYLVESWQES